MSGEVLSGQKMIWFKHTALAQMINLLKEECHFDLKIGYCKKLFQNQGFYIVCDALRDLIPFIQF